MIFVFPIGMLPVNVPRPVLTIRHLGSDPVFFFRHATSHLTPHLPLTGPFGRRSTPPTREHTVPFLALTRPFTAGTFPARLIVLRNLSLQLKKDGDDDCGKQHC